MSLDKEYLKSKVVQGISVMPSDVVVYRENLNNYNELLGYEKITELIGVLYTSNNKSRFDITLKDKGEITSKTEKKFLVDYNPKSILVKKGDFIIYKDTCYEVINPGEEFEIYFDMQVKEHEWIKV